MELDEPPGDHSNKGSDEEDWYSENLDEEDVASEVSEAFEPEEVDKNVNQTISIKDTEAVVSMLKKIVANAKTDCRNHKSLTLDDVTLYRIRLMKLTLNLCCALDCGMAKASDWAAKAEGRGSTEMLPENLYKGRWNKLIIDDLVFHQAVKEYLRLVGKYAQAKDMNYYIPEWFGNERQMWSWDKEGREIPPVLEGSEQVVVKWFHDESTFNAHDHQTLVWQERGKAAGIQKKGEGLLMKVANFILLDYGWLRGRENNQNPVPDEEHVFIYNNATIHTKLPNNSPNVATMTLKPSKHVGIEILEVSGEKVKIRMVHAQFSDGQPQELYYPDNYSDTSLHGQFKGLINLLQE
ncbi:hypothetical protein FRC07_000214 [Ceratobasidium sp. 392]|nr:hypothetical protein FRC07_000214 [Ceratobasidium sp. 392]